MNKFLKDLEKELKKMKMSNETIAEIIADHKEMMEEAVNDGLTDEELYEKFGNPEVLAKDLYEDEKEVKVNMNEYQGQNGTIEGFTFYKAFPTTELNEILIKLVSEDVQTYPYDGDTVEVHYNKVDDIEKYEMSLENGVFKLKRSFSKSGIFNRRTSGEFVVRYPKLGKLDKYTIEIVSGDGEIKGIDTKELVLKSTSGDFELHGVISGPTTLTTVSGDFELFDVETADVKMNAVSGDFEGKNIKIEGNAKLNTVSGDFEFYNVTAKEVDFNSVSGDLEAKEFYCEKIDLKSVSGDVEISNNDKTKEIVIGRKKTLSGDIRIT